MRARPPGRELLDHPILGGRAYLGSALWAGFLLALGLVLWGVGAYTHRDGGPDPRWLLATLAVSCTLVVFRRTAPGAVLAAATLVLAADAAVGPSTAVVINYGEALYAACVWGRRRLANGVLAAVCAGGVVLFALLVFAVADGALHGGPLAVAQAVGLYVLAFGSPTVSGLSVREHRLRTSLERERARRIERMAELDRRNAVAEERGRVARELHDVVANHLSAVAVQSTAALSMRESDPERTRRILGVIRDSSLRGLTEMRAMIGVLRGPQDAPELEAVTPRLDDADRLLADAREAGLEVDVVWTRRDRPLPQRADSVAYRVLQESLTNAMRYADPMRVEIALDYPGGARGGHGAHSGASGDGELLVLTVSNGLAGKGAREPGVLDGHGAGAGLTGMRERVQLLGGRFSAGPVEGRVWRVRAEIPLVPDEERPGAGRREPIGGGAGPVERPDGAEAEEGAAGGRADEGNGAR
ncbi:sensor histidine kinase [Streptomonospora wellingtoniae]|uniref:histidine kinase n=1 Tax=Streptomonospora wellingtoniae TaxID=3075544 RepID=A0ABU2KX63_9ACTN|nr:histidine kinase [Streptomonospora sp. DSM 45055]MDT0303901.1 histidine kinase [Streptomonospora sp. DSM 45055]